MSQMRLIFMGTPEFAVPAFERICAANYDVVAVVCQPDRPSGRGLRNIEPAMKKAATARGIPVLQPQSLKDPSVRASIELLHPDIIVVAAFGQKLPAWLLTLPPLGCYNIHASILPKYRGAAPVAHAILNGDSKTGVTIFRMVEKMDAGPILRCSELDILPDETAGELTVRLAELGARVVVEALEILRANSELRTGDSTAGEGSSWHLTTAATKLFVEQNDAQATLAPKLSKEEGTINWSQPAERIARMVRAFNPWPVATTTLQKKDGKKTVAFGILRARPQRTDALAAPDTEKKAGRVPYPPLSDTTPGAVCTTGEPPVPGTIIAISRAGIEVATGRGTLVIERVRPENRTEMDAYAFVNGYRLTVGQTLGS